MLNNEKLRNIAEENELSLFNSSIYLETLYKQGIEFYELDSFLSLGHKLNNKILYFYYVYYQEEEFLIPDEYHERYIGKIQQLVSKKIKEHNAFVGTYDFNEPASLYLYFIQNGIIHFLTIENEKFDLLMSYEEKIKDIMHDISNQIDSEEMKNIRLEALQKRDADLENLRNYVLEDKKFHTATNQSLRSTYANRLFEINPEFMDILRAAGYDRMNSFFDETWKIYKAKNSNTKA